MADISLLPPDHYETADDAESKQEETKEDENASSDPYAWTENDGDTENSGDTPAEASRTFFNNLYDGDADSGVSSQQDDECLMSPSQRLDKYALSDNILYRQMVPSILVEMIRECGTEELEADLPKLMATLTRLADDREMTIRADVCTRLGGITSACNEASTRLPALRHVGERHVLPLVARLLGDDEPAVRKAAYSALLHLMEQRSVPPAALQQHVCPRVVHYTRQDALMDYQTGAVTLMSKMVPLLGQEATERLFLQRFAELCTNPMFYIRKICASSFGEFCAVVGPEAYETVLLPRFLELCCDEVWGVRKACAEVIMTVSCACPPLLRRTRLAHAFSRLLDDQSRWVRMSAFQTLGPFISTFAEPSIIGLSYNQMGELVLINPEGAEFRVNSPALTDASLKAVADLPDTRLFYPEQPRFTHREMSVENSRLNVPPPPPPPLVIGIGTSDYDFDKHWDYQPDESPPVVENDIKEDNEDRKELDKFNSHQYWYVSPEMPLDPEIVKSCLPEKDDMKNDPNNSDNDIVTDHLIEKLENMSFNTTWKSVDETKNENESMELSESICGVNATDDIKSQETSDHIVPPVLIAYFMAMTDGELAGSTDSDMAYHCAFSLPAVALTLGRANWHVLSKTCDALAADMQYKVRRTLASSLHELALILGQELATKHLLPIFDGLLKDLDEVRIGVLKHLAHFLELIGEEQRLIYLPKLTDFLQTDNEWNWRFREELAKQLLAAVPLYAPRIRDASRYLGQLVHELMFDRVCAVRAAALELTCELVKHTADADWPLCARLLFRLCEDLAHSKRWARRQAFALLCARLVSGKALQPSSFAAELMPHLLDLSWDPVPNVRLAVSRTLAQDVLANEYFSEEQHESLQTVVRRMQSDRDRDVRHFALLAATHCSGL